MQYKVQANTLKEFEKHEADIKMIRHDINNHKVVLHNLIKNNEYANALKYIESLANIVECKNDFVYTNHKILNALLLNKNNICLNNNISFSLDIKIPDKIYISDFDLCIIIGNLLDNAIDACLKLDETTNRYINIKAKIINSNYVFEVINSYNGYIKISNNRFLTSKKDSLNHGLGLTNVQSTINKYYGSFIPSYDSNEFNVLAIIPIK